MTVIQLILKRLASANFVKGFASSQLLEANWAVVADFAVTFGFHFSRDGVIFVKLPRKLVRKKFSREMCRNFSANCSALNMVTQMVSK